MFRTKCLLLPFVLLALTAPFFAQSHPGYSANRKNFKIAGNAVFGYSMTMGDFSISGVGYQVLPQGPSTIGECTVGTECTLYLSPYPASGFCMYCQAFSGGVYLDQNLLFTLTAFYGGGDTLTMHVNVAGTVTEYALLNCQGEFGVSCDLGPAQSTVRISGHGTANVSMMYTPGDITTLASGATITFSGVAHVEDTP
jgi:hypothetical protein